MKMKEFSIFDLRSSIFRIANCKTGIADRKGESGNRNLGSKAIMLFALSFALLFGAYAVCDAQLAATPGPDGIIELKWSGGNANIYRDTSPLKGLDSADLDSRIWEENASSVWVDGNDAFHPTTNGTEYYYAADISGTLYYAHAIADMSLPTVENIAAMPSPFSPDGDKFEDTTEIFFTLTETTSVTLDVWKVFRVYSKVRKIKDSLNVGVPDVYLQQEFVNNGVNLTGPVQIDPITNGWQLMDLGDSDTIYKIKILGSDLRIEYPPYDELDDYFEIKDEVREIKNGLNSGTVNPILVYEFANNGITLVDLGVEDGFTHDLEWTIIDGYNIKAVEDDLEIESGAPVRNLLPFDFPDSFPLADINLDADNNIILDSDLRNAFVNNYGIMLSQNTIILVLNSAEKWLVSDLNRSYTVTLNGANLDVGLEIFPPGDNFVEWDGKDDDGNDVDDGRYIYRFESSGTTDIAGNSLLQSVSGDVWVRKSPFEVKDISVTPTPFSPDGDKIRDVAEISYYITDYADYVSGNIFAVEGGEQTIIATIYKERLAYYWDFDDEKWVEYRIVDGIDPGLSTENFYMKPINMSDYYTNWEAVDFSLYWDGSGATDASSYIIRIEAVQSNGTKTVAKTHEIIVETPSITPNDKSAPIVRFTFPADKSVYTAPLEYVRAYLDDGQGTGIDLVNSKIYLLGPVGETIPGQLSNDGSSSITWRLHEALPADGSGDGKYTIVVSTVDYAKNVDNNLKFEFEYDTSVNDTVPPYVDGLPIVMDENGVDIESILEDGSTIIYDGVDDVGKAAAVPLDSIKIKVCDKGSGIDLGGSLIELVKIVGPLEIKVAAEMSSIPDSLECGDMFLQLSTPLGINNGSDGYYKLIVTPMDMSGNTITLEYLFAYETVEDADAPYVSSAKLMNESDEIIIEGLAADPIALGQVSETIAAIHASVADPDPSGGISSDPAKSYISLEGPSGPVSGSVEYRMEGSEIADIVFVPDSVLSEVGNYTATIMVADIADNQGSAIAVFEYVEIPSIIEDTEPPLVSDVVVVSPSTDNAGPICLDKYPYVNDAQAVEVTLDDVATGVDTELSFIRLIEPDVRAFLSILDPDYEDYITELGAGNIHSGLRDRIDGTLPDSEPLSDDAIVLIEEESRKWLINDFDMNRMFTAKKRFNDSGEPDGLNIYERYAVNAELATSDGVLSLAWPVPLSINGWYTLDVFAVDSVRRLLFSIDLDSAAGDVVAELDYRTVSDELEDEFDITGGKPLSENVIVDVKDRGCLWLVTDLGQKELDVYTAGGCRWRRIDDQKTYVIERIVWRDGDNIRGRLDIYESNSTTIQVPDVLFFDNVPPEMTLTVLYDDTELTAPGIDEFNKIRADIAEDGSGVDYDATGIVVEDVRGKRVPGSLALDKDNGLTEWLSEADQSLESSFIVDAQTRDMAGNEATASIDIQAILDDVDALDPEVVSVDPEDGALFSDTITQVSAVLKDNSGAGIDLDESVIEVDAPPGVPDWWKIKGGKDIDEANQTIIWKFRQSLATDGRCDGEYDVYVRAYDNEGRRSERFYSSFTYDTRPPTVIKIEMGSRPWIAGSYIPVTELRSGGTNRALDRIDVELEDELSDIDVVNSSVEILGPNGSITTEKSHNGIDSVVLDFPPLATDGSSDGIYQINIKAVDSLGNTNPFPYIDPYTYTFVYDTQPPHTAESSPEAGAVVLSRLDEVRIRLDDGDVGVGVDVMASADALFVNGPRGQLDGTRDAENGDTIIFKLSTPLSATDSSDDGIYTVKYRMADKVGNLVDTEFTFEYRALAPRLVSVEVSSDGETLDLSDAGDEQQQQFSKAVTHVTVVLEDRSGKGLNFEACDVIVGGPGVSEQDTTENDGVDTIIYNFADPLATDGSDDGEYWVYVRAEDNAGDLGEYIRIFRYDTRAPEVVSTIPADGSIINEPFSEVSATLADALTEVDLLESKISLSGPTSISALQVHNGVDTIALQFFELADNGTADGRYEISVDTKDILGSKLPEPYVFSFIYDTKPPEVVSTEPASGDIVATPIEQVVVNLSDGDTDSTAGIDLDSCGLELVAPDGQLVNGQVLRTEPGTLGFAPADQMAVDGTDDGTYTIRIVTQDQAGNISSTISVRFVYATRSPTVASTIPADGDQLRMPVSFVSASLLDNSGAGLNLEVSSVTLLGPGMTTIPGVSNTTEPDTVTYTLNNILATDNTADGIYILDIVAADNTGTSVSYQTSFTYDRTPPVVTSVLPPDGSSVSENLSFISVRLADAGSGVNLEGTGVQLVGPGGNVVASQVNDGVDTIKLEFDPLPTDSSADGQYTISVTPVDNVGNTVITPRIFSFVYDTVGPVVMHTEPKAGSTVIVALDRVSARLADTNGVGTDLEASEIHLYDPSGGEIQGIKTSDAIDTIILSFPALAVDGTEDGSYTITVVSQDVVGNMNTQAVVFEYKTIAPMLTDVVVASEDAELSLVGEDTQRFERSITEVRVILEDKSGNGLDFDRTIVAIDGPGVSELDTIENNEVDTITYTFGKPFANDGSDDGLHMIGIRAVDADGHWADYLASFVFDNTAPEVTSITPADGSVISESISEVLVTLADSLSELDLFDSDISISGPVVMTGEKVNNGVDTVTLRFFELPDDGTADGLYKISVTPEDILENRPPEAYKFSFIVDTTAPKVASSEPADGEMVTDLLESVQVVLTDGQVDSSAGINLDACSLELIGPDGQPVNGELQRSGTDTLSFALAATDDGPVDGSYTMMVATQDMAGNTGTPISITFSHVTKSPAVKSTIPANGAQLSIPIDSVSAMLVDNSGAGLELENSMLSLIGPDGIAVPGTHSVNGQDTIIYTLDNLLATNGTADGLYTLSILVADKTGATASYRTTFIFDTKPPVVSSITPADGDMIKEGIEAIYVKLEDDGSGVDLGNSSVTLEGPMDLAGAVLSNDGINTLEFRFPKLAGSDAEGPYIIGVVPVDNIGNKPPEPETFSFIYDITPPAVQETVPENGSTVVVALDRVSALLDDANGTGPDFATSIIQLWTSDGSQIVGTQSVSDGNLVLTFPEMAIDGSDNGEYVVTLAAWDMVGNVSPEYSFRFDYMPTAPGITELIPENGSSVDTPVERISVNLGDKSGSGIDLANSWIKLLAPDGMEVAGQMSNDGKSELHFDIQDSFSNDGTDDGEYVLEINAVDNKGNAAQLSSSFIYDTSPCVVSKVYIGNSASELVLDPHAVVLSDYGIINRINVILYDAGSGVDLAASTVSLIDSNGSSVDAQKYNNGIDTIGLQFDALEVDGLYTLNVDPVDKLDNSPLKDSVYTFIVDTAVPKIASSTPKSGATVVNTVLEEISIQLDDKNGSGINSETISASVSGPNGDVSGILEVKLEDSDTTKCTLVYKLDAPLSMDASDDGEYAVNVWFADIAGNGNIDGDPVTFSFTYDTVQPGGPVISNVGVFPKAFSPNGDGVYEETAISFVLSKDANVKVLIYDFNGVLMDTLLEMDPRPAGMNSLAWDGKIAGDDSRILLPDGTYLIKIDAVDNLGLTGAIESTSVTIDIQPPSVDRPLVSNNPFTPDGDGFADTVAIGFVVSGSQPEDSVTVDIYNQSLEKISSPYLDRTFTGDGEYSAVWWGDGGTVDGEYSFLITAQDMAGNIREVSGTVAMDKSGPVIGILTPETNLLNTKESPILLSGTATDWSGVRSVSMVGLFTPTGADGPIDDSSISNWVNMTFSGDKIDNDGDGQTDEEQFNERDDDGDGLVDEDLAAQDGKLVYWTHQLTPQANGEYVIRIKASDPIDHDTVYSEYLRLVYDVAPPLHIDTVGESSSSIGFDNVRVKNGDYVTVTTNWDESDYNVTVDFSELDSNFGESPLVADSYYNGRYVADYVVTKDNTRSDGAKTITITAEDKAGNITIIDTFNMSLKNELPMIVSMTSPDGRTSYANGSTVEILLTCDAADLEISANFSSLDFAYTPEKVQVVNNGDKTYLIRYTVSPDNIMLDRSNIPIEITVSDGLESVISEYLVSLDNVVPVLKQVRVKQNDQWNDARSLDGGYSFLANVAFANDNTIEIETVWDAAGYDISANFSSMDSTYKNGSENVESVGDDSSVYIISYTLNRANKMPDGRDNTVTIEAVDLAGNKSQFIVRLDLDNTAPEFSSVASTDGDAIYKNGDTVSLLAKLDSAEYEVSADFSELDSTYSTRANEVQVTDNGDGSYTIKYGISQDNTLGKSKVVSGIAIPITAVDPVGNSTMDSSMVVELDNIPPELELLSPAADALTFEARIEVKGKTETDAIAKVEPRLTINTDPEVSVGNDGIFSCLVALEIGYNTLTVSVSDLAGNVTAEKLTILYRPLIKAVQGGTIYLPEKRDDEIAGNDTRVVIPAGASRQDFSVEISQLESPPSAMDNPDIGVGVVSPLAAYKFDLKDESGENDVSISFVKPIQMYLQYQGLKKLNGTAVVFRWDGVKWNRIGGEEDRANNTVKVTVNSMSIFGIFMGKDVSGFALKGAFPNPFTPNDDGVNDVVSFYIDNPDNAETIIRIFDLRGALIRRLDDGLSSWDGLDDAYESANMGVYIYQVELDGEVKGGTIVLAR